MAKHVKDLAFESEGHRFLWLPWDATLAIGFFLVLATLTYAIFL